MQVFGFAPSSTCSTPPPSAFDAGDEQQSAFDTSANEEGTEMIASGFASIHVDSFNNATGYHHPPSPISRHSSALTTELQDHQFESAMHRLKSLRTSNSAEKNEEIQLRTARSNTPATNLGTRSPRGSHPKASRSASLSSTAMAIPLTSRAYTAPDQLPELTESMAERLLAKMDDSPGEDLATAGKNKTPEDKEICSSQRLKNFDNKRVPSAAFLNDLNLIKLRQESMNFEEVKRSLRARNRSP